MATPFDVRKIPIIYRGSVKNLRALRAPTARRPGRFVFEYTDDYSVFDYGKMPDKLPGKGAAMAIGSAHLFECLENPASWKRLARSPAWDQIHDRAFRDRLRRSTAFREVKKSGLPTHYRGLITKSGQRVRTAGLREATNLMEVDAVAIHRPEGFAFAGLSDPQASSAL